MEAPTSPDLDTAPAVGADPVHSGLGPHPKPAAGGPQVHDALLDHPEPDTDPETASVSVTVSALTPVSGKGSIKYVASVTLDIGGVELALHGWTIRLCHGGRMRAFQPAFRDPRSGEWESCVELPPDLLRAVGEALLGQVPGGIMTVRMAGAASA